MNPPMPSSTFQTPICLLLREEKAMNPSVLAVHASGMHTMSKHTLPSIMLIEGLGVEGDAHRGSTAKHGSRVRANPTQPNLRQVHLIHSKLFDELRERDFEIRARNWTV